MKISDKYDTKVIIDSKKPDVLGFLTIDLKLMLGSLKEQIELGNQQIQDNYYDPFETDPDEIDKKLQQVHWMTEMKMEELSVLYQQIDQRTSMLQGLAVDIGQVRNEIKKKNE